MSADEAVSTTPADTQVETDATIEEAVQKAKRAYALKNFEQAVEHYAFALELKTKKYGDSSPDCVDLYFAYGKALLENAIAQNSVLGKEETSVALQGEEEMNQTSGPSASASDARIHFGDDANVEEDPETLAPGNIGPEEQTVDLFAEATKAEPEELQREGADDGDEDADPEDDFNAAWEVLEVARSLYEAQKDTDEEAKLKLADTYIALGDISLETEKLDQAVDDYSAAATLKAAILPVFSRQIAEVHYKLCIVYDMTSGRLANAIEHAEKAEASVRARLNEITARLQSSSLGGGDPKGKGKATAPRFATDILIEDMTKSQLESEVKDLEGLLEDLSLKIEELKTSPDTAEGSAPELVAKELDRDLNGSSSSRPQVGPVNDLTSMVVKRKKQTPAETGDKRKAEEDDAEPPEKKVKIEG